MQRSVTTAQHFNAGRRWDVYAIVMSAVVISKGKHAVNVCSTNQKFCTPRVSSNYLGFNVPRAVNVRSNGAVL